MFFKKSKLLLPAVLIFINTLFYPFIPVYATTFEGLQEEAEARKSLPVQTNNIENWPAGPALGAESAILMEVNTGVILYAKNIDLKEYPASTTKLMTCLLAVEHAGLNDMIPFSHDAVFSIERGSSSIGMDVGQSITLEQALYGILVGSANEVANAVAEYVGGDMETFADMMTAKAKELGCKNTHFTNAHGLFEENHYTTAYDLSLIANAFFRNELLSKIADTYSYQFLPTATQPDEFVIRNKHKLISGEIVSENIIGGKTGYTDIARQTLVTCAEKNGMKLVCVIMKEESPEQFHDTVKLFDYGFSNFHVVSVAENETRYIIENSSFFQTGSDVFGNSSPLMSLNQNSYLIMPKTTEFDQLTSEISYQADSEFSIADIDYFYHGAFVGNATIDFATENRSTYEFDQKIASELVVPAEPEEEENIVFVNIKNLIFIVVISAAVVMLLFIIRNSIRNYHFNRKRRYRRKRIRPTTTTFSAKKLLSRKPFWTRKKRKKGDFRNYDPQ